MKKEKGITLVALVVTIVILILLAGVSIYLTIGENGIIAKAKQAKENTLIAQIEQEEYLNALYDEIESIAEGGNISGGINESKLIEFKTKIAEAITKKGVPTNKEDTADTMANNIEKIESKTVTLVKQNLSSRYQQTISLKDLENYEELTIDNFLIVNKQMSEENVCDPENDILVMSKNYNQTTGTLTLGKQTSHVYNGAKWTFWNIYDVYVVR